MCILANLQAFSKRKMSFVTTCRPCDTRAVLKITISNKWGETMDFSRFHHEAKSRYAYGVDVHNLHIRLRTGKSVVSKITVVSFDPFVWEKGVGGEYEIANVLQTSMTLEQTVKEDD